MSFRAILFKLTTKIVNNGQQHYHNLILTKTNQHNLTYDFIRRFIQIKPIKCWQCGIERKNIAELFCEQCNIIQNPQNKDNYFKIFELDEHFDIDPKQLTQKYRQLQSLLHPDKFTNKSHQERGISEEFSSLVNKAYNILNTPLKRAIHLLNLKGELIEEDHRFDDPDFLMQIMELNEEVEDADNAEKLTKLKRKNDGEIAKLIEEIKASFEHDQIDKAKETIVKLKYYNSVSLHINHLMRERGIVE